AENVRSTRHFFLGEKPSSTETLQPAQFTSTPPRPRRAKQRRVGDSRRQPTDLRAVVAGGPVVFEQVVYAHTQLERFAILGVAGDDAVEHLSCLAELLQSRGPLSRRVLTSRPVQIRLAAVALVEGELLLRRVILDVLFFQRGDRQLKLVDRLHVVLLL